MHAASDKLTFRHFAGDTTVYTVYERKQPEATVCGCECGTVESE